MSTNFETLKIEAHGAVVFATLDAPPMNMLGPELVRNWSGTWSN